MSNQLKLTNVFGVEADQIFKLEHLPGIGNIHRIHHGFLEIKLKGCFYKMNSFCINDLSQYDIVIQNNLNN